MNTTKLHKSGDIHLSMVTRVLKEVKNQIDSFTVFDKENEYKDGDLVTTADYAAQQLYTTMIWDFTTDAGILAEEEWLYKLPKNWENILYTIDPVDGTKALVRRQSDGIGTLMGVVDTEQNKIVWWYVWDVMTGEIYYSHPDSDRVYRTHIDTWSTHIPLLYQPRTVKRIQMLDDIRHFPKWLQDATESDWYWQSLWITNGSIWTNMARLWKGEVDAVLLKAWITQPRDRVPCAWISDAMWYTTIQIDKDNTMNPLDIDKSRELKAMKVPYQLIVHQKELADVLSMLENHWFTLK